MINSRNHRKIIKITENYKELIFPQTFSINTFLYFLIISNAKTIAMLTRCVVHLLFQINNYQIALQASGHVPWSLKASSSFNEKHFVFLIPLYRFPLFPQNPGNTALE